jgi:predicted regulator of Ras-like GTPase activity (Roadblock/LC7/MglB family)
VRCARVIVALGEWRIVSSAFTPVLDSLTRQRGVRASLVVSATDGIAIDSNLQIGQDGSRVAALAASLYRKARRSALAAGLGSTGFMQLEAETGRLCLIGGDELVLAVVAEPEANVGLIRVQMLRAAEALA